MKNHLFTVAALAFLTALPASSAAARPTEIRISVEYKLISNPAEITVEFNHQKQAGGAADRMEVEVRRSGSGSGGAAGALNDAFGGATPVIDTTGYTKVGRVTHDGKTYDVYERAGAGGAMRGTVRIPVTTQPGPDGLTLYAGGGQVSITGGTPQQQAAYRAELERAGAQIVDQLNRTVPYSQDETDRLFDTQPGTITKTVPWQAAGQQGQVTVTIHSEARRIIDAPLGEDP